MVLSHGRSAQLESSSTYQALTQTLASVSQSLEETLKDFIKMTGQSISDVRSATMVNTQAIAKLETQMGQLANHLGERDKGKLPSPLVPNPKVFAIRNSSNSAHGARACVGDCHTEVREKSRQSSSGAKRRPCWARTGREW